MSVKIEIDGIDEVIESLTATKRNLREGVKEALAESGIILKEEVQESIRGNRSEPQSIDTGEFLSSIEHTTSDDSVEVFSDVEQAVFMEFGTSKIQERRHFRNTLDRVKPAIEDKIQEQVTNSID